jgi:hypothetical protein
MNQEWIRQEEVLWTRLHQRPAPAPYRHFRHKAKGSEERKKYDKELAKRRAKEFAAGWQAYTRWVDH